MAVPPKADDFAVRHDDILVVGEVVTVQGAIVGCVQQRLLFESGDQTGALCVELLVRCFTLLLCSLHIQISSSPAAIADQGDALAVRRPPAAPCARRRLASAAERRRDPWRSRTVRGDERVCRMATNCPPRCRPAPFPNRLCSYLGQVCFHFEIAFRRRRCSASTAEVLFVDDDLAVGGQRRPKQLVAGVLLVTCTGSPPSAGIFQIFVAIP